jgi:aerobic carbon-monoxide dehydrogenase medium subunit
MIPAAFDYVRAGSAEEAVAALGEHGDDAKLLAGGMSLLPLMKLRLATPAVLVDVGRLGELSYVRDGGDHIAIGALTRHRDLETNDLLAEQCAVLRKVASEVGDNQVRHRGTIGGSVAHGDPASDLPALLAQGASPADAAQRAAEGTDPPGDLNATPDYREHLARVLVRRALEAASA